MLVSNEFESQEVIVICSLDSATNENQMSRFIMPINSQELSGLYPLSVYSVVSYGVIPSEITMAVSQVLPGVPAGISSKNVMPISESMYILSTLRGLYAS